MNNPTITLAGVDYQIPKLAIKQNRHIEPLAIKHSEYFVGVIQNKGQVRLLNLTPEQALDFTTIIYWAITRAKPEMTLAQFEDLPISMREIMVALPVCLQQSGLYRVATEENPPTGEDQLPSTGTESSPSTVTA